MTGLRDDWERLVAEAAVSSMAAELSAISAIENIGLDQDTLRLLGPAP